MKYSTIKCEKLPGWKETILAIYKECRIFPGWKVIYEVHDKEDRDYFDMLDELRRRKMISVKDL